MINIRVNDQPTQLEKTLVLNDFLIHWASAQTEVTQKNTPPAFAVAINGEFVPRSEYDATLLQEGDALDIVTPVGGG